MTHIQVRRGQAYRCHEHLRVQHKFGLWTTLASKPHKTALGLDFTSIMITLLARRNISSGITNRQGGYQEHFC